MATWTTIADTVLEPLKPIRSVDGLALRDNPIAIAEGASGAPRIQTAAIDTSAVTNPKLATDVNDQIRAASGLSTIGDVYLSGLGDSWSSSTSYTTRSNDYIIFRNNYGRSSVDIQLRVDYNEDFSSGSVQIDILANGSSISNQTVTGDTAIFATHSTSASITKYTVRARATDGGATGQTYFRGFTASITGI